MKEVIITSILKGFDQKKQFFGTGTRYSLENLGQCGKRVKNKIQKDLGYTFYVCKSYNGKTGMEAGFPPPPPSLHPE